MNLQRSVGVTHWFTSECVSVKKGPSHGDTLQLSEWACLQWMLDTPREEAGGLPVAGKWLGTGSQPTGTSWGQF